MEFNIEEMLNKKQSGKQLTVEEQTMLIGLGFSMLELHQLIGRIFNGEAPEEAPEAVNAGGYL